MDLGPVLLAIYLIGVGVGLIAVDEPFPGRVLVAASWPVGLLAFAAVLTILLLALPVALPRVAAAFATIAAVSWVLYQMI